MLKYIVFFGALVQLIGIFAYIKDIFKGSVKPNRITWLLWSIAPMIATGAAISDGVTFAIIPIFMTGFAPFLVFLTSFINKQSYWKLNKLDYICGMLAVLALILWGITKNPSIAILLAIISDAIAAIPTFIKTWEAPETESLAPYTTGLINAFTSFFALQFFNFSELAFPIYLITLHVSMIIVIQFRKKTIPHEQSSN